MATQGGLHVSPCVAAPSSVRGALLTVCFLHVLWSIKTHDLFLLFTVCHHLWSPFLGSHPGLKPQRLGA